jgi:DNA-binding response OmpR family regulator
MTEIVHAHHCALDLDGDCEVSAVPSVFAEQVCHEQQTEQAMVLIVDDNADVCEVISAFLTEEDFRIECAYSAQEALQRLATGRVDLALIDLLLPGGSGVEVAERFAANGAAVIIMSGALDAEERLAESGFKLLRKPFRLKTLGEMVRDSVAVECQA